MFILYRFKILSLILIALVTFGCKSGSDDFTFVGSEDTTEDNAIIIEDVKVESFIPTDNPVRITNTTNTTFGVTVNSTAGSDLTYVWKLNGTLISSGTSPFLEFSGSSAGSGSSNLSVEVSNAISSDTKIFNLHKNTAPSIDTTSPAAAGNNVTCGSGSITFDITASDVDSDTLSYTWKLNGAPHGATFAVTNGAGTSSNVFTPTCSFAGSNTITVDVNDGYETTSTSWSVTVINPIVAQIIGQTPVGSPIVIQEGANQGFTVSVTGQAPFAYTWGINADPPVSSGATPSYTVLASSFPVPNGTTELGDNTFTATVTDDNATTDSYVWNIKINSAPVLSSPNPAESSIKMNYLGTRAFSVVASDNNNDTLTYTWTLNGGTAPGGVFTGTGSSITFDPTIAQLGDNTITVSVTDGFIATPLTQSWSVNVNMFSDPCNGITTGQVCTYVGAAGLGGGIDPIAQPQVAKMRPYVIENDGAGNLFIADAAQSVIWFYNRSGAPVSVIGTTVPAGQIAVVAGSGARGTSSAGVSPLQYRLYETYGLAWDSDRRDLYVSSYHARRIIRFTSTGSSEHRMCYGGNANDAARHVEGGPAVNHGCDRPTGLVYDSVNKRIIVANSDDDNIKYFDISNADPALWTGHMLICDKNGGGACQAGTVNGAIGNDSVARVNNPWALDLDANGLLHFTTTGHCRIGVLNDSGTNYSFYNGDVTINSGQAKFVGGDNNCNTYATSSSHRLWSSHRVRSPRGIAAYYNGSTYYGWFVSNYDHDAISFFNNTNANITIGNTTISAKYADYVWGNRVDGYSGEGTPANANLVWLPWGMQMDSTGNNLYIADRDNYRLRALDVSVNNGITSTIIAGKEKADFSGGSNTPAPSVLMNRPFGITYDSTNDSMVFADYNNCRIRSVDNSTGAENVLIGQGCGNSDSESEDPSDVYMRGPRGVLVMNNGVIYSENTQSPGGNRNAQIRVWNRNAVPTDFFGVSVPAGKVSTIAGNFVLGSRYWNAANEGAQANTVGLYRINSLTTDGTNLYYAEDQLHCIVKITPAGVISTYAGKCRTDNGANPYSAGSNTLGHVNGTPYNSSSVRFRYPYQVHIDPLYAADGNMFVADNTDQGTSRIRYINTRGSSVQIADQTVSANSVATIFDTDGYGYGVAAYGDWICFTSGRQTYGQLGSHHIKCFDRTDPTASTVFRAGPTGSTVKGGIQGGTEDEGAIAGLVKFFTPFSLAFDNDGNLFVTEYDGHVIRKIEKWW